jgi:hypothetical protein
MSGVIFALALYAGALWYISLHLMRDSATRAHTQDLGLMLRAVAVTALFAAGLFLACGISDWRLISRSIDRLRERSPVRAHT